MSKNFVIGICGGSCSGKTTFARLLQRELGEDKSALVYQDSYYIDQSHRFKEDGGDVNFDHPSSIDFDLLAEQLHNLRAGLGIDVPIYNFVSHSREKNTLRVESRPIVIVDGTLLLSQPAIRPCLDDSYFLACPESLRFERRKYRDTHERGRHLDGVIRQFENHVKPMHDSFVEPSQEFAKSVVACPTDFDENLGKCLARLWQLLT